MTDAGRAIAGIVRAVLPDEIRRAIATHALAQAPDEACGLVVGTGHLAEGGRALRFVPTRSLTPSPSRYEIDPSDLLRITLAADAAGEVIWGIVHSHPSSAARPSSTDIERAFDAQAVHLIVSLAGREPDLRAWWILSGAAIEVGLDREA